MRYALILMILALPALAGETRLRKRTHKRGGMLYYDDEKIITEDFKVQDSADVMLKAGTKIVVKPGTHFKPGTGGKTHLVIATQLTASTTPSLQDSNTPCETDPSPPPRKPTWRLKLSKRGLQNVSMFAGWALYWF